MLQNMEEVTFGKLLKALREVYGVKQSNLAQGLCSKSMMCYFEFGNRLPDYWMRNRLMSRLGLHICLKNMRFQETFPLKKYLRR